VRRRGAWVTSLQIRRIRRRFRATDTERISASSIGPNPNLAIRAGSPRSLFTHTTSPRTLSLAASRGHLVKGWLAASSYRPPPARVSPRVAPPRPVHQTVGRKMRLSDFCNRTTTRAPHELPDSQARSPFCCDPRRRTAPRFTPAHFQPSASGETPGEASLDGEPSASASSQSFPVRLRIYPMAAGVMPRGPGGASIERSSRAAPPGCGVFNREPSLRPSL
jgi:hypothetical protein